MCNCKETSTLNGCKDYSLMTANTGIASVSNANPNLNGTGSMATLLTAEQNGTLLKSITIKAIEPVTTGMIRLFISDGTTTSLYKEVPVPVSPNLKSTPTPTPVVPMFETTLVGNLELKAGHTLRASTQTADSFILVAEGLNWDYPGTLPSDCCNFKQVSAETSVGVISNANTNLNGGGNIPTILTAPAGNGTLVKSITIKALQSTSINGMVRLFIKAGGESTYSLMREIEIPQTTQSAFEPSYKQVIELNFHLQEGYSIGATTQNSEGFAITVEAEKWSYPI